MRPPVPILFRLFRLALRSLPAEFRHAYGDEILQVAAERAEALPPGGRRLRFWTREILDLLRTAVRERLRPLPRKAGIRLASPPLPVAARRSPEIRHMLDTFVSHLRLAGRNLARRPAFAAVVVLLLALGIGANTAMFSLCYSVLLEPLPFEEPERLVRLWGTWNGGSFARVSPPDYLDYRQDNEVLSSLAATTSFQPRFAVTGEGEPERVTGALVTASFFETLGVDPAHGRGFGADEAAAGGDRAVLLSHGYWQRRFGGDPAIVGSTLTVDGEPHAVLGVLPAGFDYPAGTELWRPIPHQMLHESERRFHFLNPVGRLRPDVTLERADENLNLIAARLEAAYPESNESWRVRLMPLRESLIGSARTPLLLLFAAVGLLLLIACANVANLLLARALARRREMAVRGALGASRGQIFLQLLAESVALASAGGLAGVGLAGVALAGVRRLASDVLPRSTELSLSPPVLLFALALAVVTGLLFGLAPTFGVLRRDLFGRLKPGGDRGPAGGLRSRGLLVAGQVALSVVLLVGAGLLLQSFGRLLAVDPGFEAGGTLTAGIELPQARYPEAEDRARFYVRLLEEVRSLPAVASAGAISQLPMVGGGDTYVHPEERPPSSSAERRTAQLRKATPGYFETVGMGRLAGRAFGGEDRPGTPPVVVINRALALRDFGVTEPGQALGRRLVVDLGELVHAEVVGVVEDVREFGPAAPPPEIVYMAAAQYPNSNMQLVLRSAAGDPSGLAGPVRSLVHGLDPNLPLSGLSSLDALVSSSVAQPRFRALLLGLFAATALLLAAVGLYGVLAHFVGQRTREVGIRMALGAGHRAVVGLVVRRGMGLAGLGVTAGLVGAGFATRLLSSLLFGVGRLDPWTFSVVSALLLSVALAASLLPAFRATRIDPVVAMRED